MSVSGFNKKMTSKPPAQERVVCTFIWIKIDNKQYVLSAEIFLKLTKMYFLYILKAILTIFFCFFVFLFFVFCIRSIWFISVFVSWLPFGRMTQQAVQ